MDKLKSGAKRWASGHAVSSLFVSRLLALVGALLALRHRVRHWGHCYVAWTARITGWKGIKLGRNVVISRESWLNVNERRSGQPSLLILDNTFIGPNNLIAVGKTLVFREYGITGPNCAFIASSHVTTDPMRPYSTTGATARDDIYIGVNCYIGHGSSVIGSVKIGHGSIIGAGSVVRGNIPAFSVAVGDPARVVNHFDFDSNSWVKGEPGPARAHPTEDDYLKTLRSACPFPLQPISGAAFLLGDM